MKTSNVTCNSCGYPLNRGRKYCKVCGNNLRENKKVKYPILKPSQIVATVILGASIILAIIGLFGQVDQWIWKDLGEYNLYGTTGIQWFFFDGWKSLFDSQSVEELTYRGVQFGFEFASYLLALVGVLLSLIIYIQSLVRRACSKHSNFCIMKFFKFFALFTLPYVFMIGFFRSFLLGSTIEDSSTYFGSIGWGVLLIVIANIIGFIASCVSHIDCPCKKEEKAPFALKQVGVAFAMAFVVLGFACAVSVTHKYDKDAVLYSGSIFYIISEFICDPTIPLEVGASFIGVAAICGVTLVAAIAYVMTKSNARKIAYSGSMFLLTIAGAVLNYYGTLSYVKCYNPEPDLENMSLVSLTFIVATVLALVALTLSIVYTAIANSKNRKVVAK